MWPIVIDSSGNKLIIEECNPKYYLCNRFITNEEYRGFSKLPFDEIVSIDSLLFPIKDRIIFNEKTARTHEIDNGKQILCVQFIKKSQLTPIFEDLDDFIFCGYDLVDEYEISALTNCGRFDETFTDENLNMFGLIPNFLLAKKIQRDLILNNPDEEHADCLLFAVWRRV